MTDQDKTKEELVAEIAELRERIYHLEQSPARIRSREKASVQQLEKEIAVRKETEAALSESEQRFRAIFENDHVVMLIVDPETGKIEDCSPGACTLLWLR